MKPHFYIKHLGRRYKIFKRTDERSAPYYVQVRRHGRLLRRCLEVNIQDQAEPKAKEIIDLILNDQMETLEAKKLRGAVTVKVPAADATIGDIERAYQDRAAVFIKERTIRGNLNALRLIVREGLGKPNLDDESVRKLQVKDAVTGAVMARFEAERLRAAGNHEEGRQRALVSINAFARFARSIFKEKFRKTYVRDCGLALPDVSEFCNEELAAPARHVKEAPPLDLVEKTFQEANKLRASDRDAYIAFLLTMCSLRRGEAQQMQWDWILWEQRAVRVPRASKSKVVRLVPVPAPVLEELRQYRALRTASIEEQLQHMDPRRPARAEATRARLEADRAFVLPAGTKWNPGNKSRANWVLDRVDALMRGCGWETQHTVHELRAYYLRHLRQTFGLEVAGEAGGHADLRVTRTHYTGLLDVSAINVPMPLDNP